MINISDITERKIMLLDKIKTYNKNIKLLLDYSTGYKKLRFHRLHTCFPYSTSRLISTIQNLHIQIREMQKEYKLINKIKKHAK